MSRIVRLAACGLLIANVIVLQGQTRKDTDSRNTVGSLCGKLAHVDSREVEKYGTTYHTSPLPNVLINLYPRDKKPCCAGTEPIERVTTGGDGGFTFAETKPGTYWLVATVDKREFKISLRLVKRTVPRTACRNQEFQIEDSGDFRIMRMVGYL